MQLQIIPSYTPARIERTDAGGEEQTAKNTPRYIGRGKRQLATEHPSLSAVKLNLRKKAENLEKYKVFSFTKSRG